MKKKIFDNLIIPKYNKSGKFLRQIHSFRNRYRPLKKKNMLFLYKNLFHFNINFHPEYVDIKKFFKIKNIPIILDIGFGNGESLLYTASNFTQCNILGIEVYLPGIINIIKKIHFSTRYFKNIKVIVHDVVEVLQYMIQDNSISIIQIFFPDPWPKLKHNKRRMLNRFFINIMLKKIVLGGLLHIITDCVLYYTSIINIMDNFKNFINYSQYYNNINFYIITKFYKKAYLKNNNIFHLVFQCIK